MQALTKLVGCFHAALPVALQFGGYEFALGFVGEVLGLGLEAAR